jgi:hypothetical protein
VGEIFDSMVQLGRNGTNEIVASTLLSPPSKGGDEILYMNSFLDAKVNFLNSLGGAYPGTVYRVNSYREAFKNPSFSGGAVSTLDNDGSPIQIACTDPF